MKKGEEISWKHEVFMKKPFWVCPMEFKKGFINTNMYRTSPFPQVVLNYLESIKRIPEELKISHVNKQIK